MIIPGEVVGVIMIAIVYASIAVCWFAGKSSYARWLYRSASHFGMSSKYRKEYLDDAERQAQLARKAWVWPWAIVTGAAAFISTARTDNRRLSARRTELHAEQTDYEIERLEAELDQERNDRGL